MKEEEKEEEEREGVPGRDGIKNSKETNNYINK